MRLNSISSTRTNSGCRRLSSSSSSSSSNNNNNNNNNSSTNSISSTSRTGRVLLVWVRQDTAWDRQVTAQEWAWAAAACLATGLI